MVVEEEEVVVVGDSMRQSCWANMPQELLREVLLRIEASEDTWPPRKSVVACAGVCRSWREITKDIVKTPELSAKITFPISVKQHCLMTESSFWLHGNADVPPAQIISSL